MLASTHIVAVGLCVGVVALAVVVRHALVQHVLSILQGLTILSSMYTPFSKYSEKAPTSSPCGKHVQLLIVSFDYHKIVSRRFKQGKAEHGISTTLRCKMFVKHRSHV